MKYQRCVYRITCKENGRVYIGSTSNYYMRSKSHLSLLRRGKHNKQEFQEDFEKFGEKAFVFEVVEEPKGDLLEAEAKWFDKYGKLNYSNRPLLYPTNYTHWKKTAVNCPEEKKAMVLDYWRKGFTAQNIARSCGFTLFSIQKIIKDEEVRLLRS